MLHVVMRRRTQALTLLLLSASGLVVDVTDVVRTPIEVVTHDPDVAATFPRTITIRDGRVGDEWRDGESFAVVSAEASVPPTEGVPRHLPPGSLIRVDDRDGQVVLVLADERRGHRAQHEGNR